MNHQPQKVTRSVRRLVALLLLFSDQHLSTAFSSSLLVKHSSSSLKRIHRSKNQIHYLSVGGRDFTSTRATGSRQSRSAARAQQHSHNDDDWLTRTTREILENTTPGTLVKGKWHEVVSLLKAWSMRPRGAIQTEQLLKRLVQERQANNTEVQLTVDLYNRVLEAWSSQALTWKDRAACQRAREILVVLQEHAEAQQRHDYNNSSNAVLLQPNKSSFETVLRAVCLVEGAIIARRVWAWMEHLYKTGKNVQAKPSRDGVLWILDAYAHSGADNAGVLAEAFLRHVEITCGIQPDTVNYNMAIKAYGKGSRQAAEHAHRILDDMKTPPDQVTYGSVISAWAMSGMKAHAVSRVEDLLRTMEKQKLEANTLVLNAVMSTWVKSRNPAAVERTYEIIQQMEQSSPESMCAPDLFSYNTHIHALSLHSKNNVTMAHRADEMLRRLETGNQEGRRTVQPRTFTYNLVIEAFCRSNSPNAAVLASNVLRRLIQRDRVEPYTYTFTQVLTALSRNGAAKTAHDLLLYMEDSYSKGLHPHAKPDAMCYAIVMMAYGRSGRPGAVQAAEDLLSYMNKRYAEGLSDVKPNRECYNTLINIWAKSGEGTYAARRAEAILEHMQALYDAGDHTVAPDLMSFNSVLNAWARSGTRCCGRKAERYLNLMWDMYRVKPNDRSYNTVINAISKSPDERKAQKALRVLRLMDNLYRAGNKEVRPNEITYTSVINSCAFPATGDPSIRRKAFDTASFTLKELQQSRYGQPSQLTYSTFIKACANLLPQDDRRSKVIKWAFRQCCRDGQVGDMVLEQIRRAAPHDLVEELLLADHAEQRKSRRMVSANDLPLEWRCNVRRSSRPYKKRGSTVLERQQ